MSWARWLRACLLVTGLAWMPASMHAQETEAQSVDSTELRIRERLRRLARPPGYDSILFLQDSVAEEDARLNRTSGSATAGDSTLAALRTLRGFALTEYNATEAQFDAGSRVLVLHGADGARARILREGNEITADSSITFDDATGRVRAVGAPTFTPETGDPVDADQLIFDLGEERGSATVAKTSYQQGGANWNVTGDMPFAAVDSTFMSHARFTSCDRDDPHYHFETDEIKIVGGSLLVARPVRMYFADVPVFWLPFIAQSINQGRTSGLLTPRFSVNDIVRTSGGHRRRVSNIGFYWAMSDYSDAIMAVDWFSDNFVALTSSMRYRFNTLFLNGSVNLRRYWRSTGATELALNTSHSWEIDERTQLRLSGNYTSSADFVRQNSFNPREVTQSIDSEGGISRRFGFGSLSVGLTRRQYLSNDRVEWTLPSANLSLSTITLLRAPPNRARFYNNVTWSGGATLTRRTLDRVQPDTFQVSQTDTERQNAGVRSNVSVGNITFSQSVDLSESTTLGVPEAWILLGDSANPTELITGAPARSITDQNLTWRTSVDYQQQLIGSTTITPRLSMSGAMFQSDTSQLAPAFVSAPSRVSFGAALKTDIYGFFPGFGGFEAIRHKVSPSVQYEWSPEKAPTDLQRNVFGSRAIQPRSVVTFTVNQTWEAKRAPQDGDTATTVAEAAPTSGGQPGEPSRVQSAQTVSLLALRTSAIRYDFIEADSVGSFLAGFETTRLSNQISSDFLRGLSVSLEHDLFDGGTGAPGSSPPRTFSPHLSSANFNFSLGSSSSIFRWLRGLAGGDVSEPAEEEVEDAELDVFDVTGTTDEANIIPTDAGSAPAPQSSSSGGRGGWNANIGYSLQRPRGQDRPASQMITGTVTMRPTASWNVSWRTAYDVDRGSFNDHTIRLSRDIHRWTANFDFLQTATGNWTFRFEVSLTDNRDLKFDYEQRNLDYGRPSGRR
jgi:hypothetical protein